MNVARYRDPLAAITTAVGNRLPESFRTLKFRLMVLITGVLLVVVGLPVALFVDHLDENYHEMSTTMLEITTGFVYQQLTDDFVAHDDAAIQQKLKALTDDPRIQLLRIYRPNGTILYSSRPEEVHRNVFEASATQATAAAILNDEAFSRVGNAYMHRHPIRSQGACLACHTHPGANLATLDVVANLTDSEQIYRYAKHLSVTGGISIIVILWIAISMLYEGQIENRLMAIINGFDRLAGGKQDAKVTMPGHHELSLLADRFNDTVEALEQAKSREESFYQEKLQRADRLVTLGEIAAVFAHEVNNPAGIIRTRADYLMHEIEESDPVSPHLEDLGIIIQQTDRIAETTHSILHYARKPHHERAAMDLNEVVRHAFKIMGPRIKKSGITVELSLAERPAVIWGGFSQLEQVFCNLINNSIDAISEMPTGRRTIGVSTAPVTRGDTAGAYRLVYWDTGCGIPPELRDEVFSPFFTTKKDGEGTGLGLFIAQKIIQDHGGTIVLDGHAQQGARFIIALEGYEG